MAKRQHVGVQSFDETGTKNGQRKKFFNCGTNLRQRRRKNYHNRTIQSAQKEINIGKKYRNNGKQVKEMKFN